MSHPQNPQNPPQQPQFQIPQYSQSQGSHPQGSQSQGSHPQGPHPQNPQQWVPPQQTPSPGYPGGGYPPQQPSGQKPPKPKKPLLKRWWFWLIVIVVLIALVSALGGGGDETSTESADSTSADEQQAGGGEKEAKAEKPAEESAHGIGDTVAADDWEITVDEVEDGVSKVGDEYLGAEAQGQFVQISLSVKNTGSEPDYFFEDDIKLADDQDNSYSADSEAGIYAAKDNILFLEEINPGNTAKGVLVFDVPEDVDPIRLTFAGGLFADPVEISLK